MSALYNTLGNYKNNPLLVIDPSLFCCTGDYLLDKEQINTCDKLNCSTCCCGKGFNNRPIHFEYSTMSNGKWANDISCDCSRGVVPFQQTYQ